MKVHIKRSKPHGTCNVHFETTYNGRTVRTTPWVGLDAASVRLIVSEEAGFIRKAKADAAALIAEQVKRGGHK